MRKPSHELSDFYHAYLKKRLRPETALEFAADFLLDLINAFGDRLDDTTPLKSEWRQFAPFEFVLQLNELLGRYKNQGLNSLDEAERSMLHDNNVLLGALVRSALTSHPDSFPDEEHFQIPQITADDLEYLVHHS